MKQTEVVEVDVIYTYIKMLHISPLRFFMHQRVGIHISMEGTQVILLYIHTLETRLQFQSIQNYIDAYTLPLLICGNVNNDHTVWSSAHSNKKGKELLDFIEYNNLILLKTGTGTWYSGC